MYDLTKLNDDELDLLERILRKASGQFDGDVAPPFRIEFINGRQNMTSLEDNGAVKRHHVASAGKET